jgi:hypothetical protein
MRTAALVMLALAFAAAAMQVGVSIPKTTTTLTWTLYTTTVINGNVTTMLLVREAECTPVGVHMELVGSTTTVVVNMGTITAQGTEYYPVPQYSTVVDIDDLLQVRSVIPFVWCTDVTAKTMLLITTTRTITTVGSLVLTRYSTTVETYYYPSVTLVAPPGAPDLLIPSTTLVPTVITRVLTTVLTTFISGTTTITETNTALLASTTYAAAALYATARDFLITTLPTVIHYVNDLSNFSLDITISAASAGTGIPFVGLATLLIGYLISRKRDE